MSWPYVHVLAMNTYTLQGNSTRGRALSKLQIFRPVTLGLHNQGILPNALKAIRAIDAQLGRELEDTLQPADSAANVSIFKNTGEQLMQYAAVHLLCPN